MSVADMLRTELNDLHGPRAGCNYSSCGVPGDEAFCPFTRDEPWTVNVESTDPILDLSCPHEWRQYWADSTFGNRPAGFYCIHCRTIENASEIIIPPPSP